MILFVVILFVIFDLCVNLQLQGVYAQDSPNTITFDNKSGETALVKLIGATEQTFEVPNGESRTVNVRSGEYYILVRYGSSPEHYSYSKGDPFTVIHRATHYSVITITLHKVVGGNYPIRASSSEEFNAISQELPSLQDSSKLNPEVVSTELVDEINSAGGRISSKGGYDLVVVTLKWPVSHEGWISIAYLDFTAINDDETIISQAEAIAFDGAWHIRRSRYIENSDRILWRTESVSIILKVAFYIPNDLYSFFLRHPMVANEKVKITVETEKTFDEWFKLALHDLAMAEKNIANEDFNSASLLAEKSVEKLLKSIFLLEGKKVVRVRLAELATRLNLSEEVIEDILDLAKDSFTSRDPFSEDFYPYEEYKYDTTKFLKEKVGRVKQIFAFLGNRYEILKEKYATMVNRDKHYIPLIDFEFYEEITKVSVLITALKHEDPYIREMAAEKLGDIKDSRAIEPLIEALGDENSNFRKTALEILEKIDSNWPKKKVAINVIPNLIADLMEEETGSLQSSKVEALEKIGKPAVMPLIAALTNKNKFFRWRAVEILRNIGDPRAIGILTKLSKNDPDLTVRESAQKALKKIQGSK